MTQVETQLHDMVIERLNIVHLEDAQKAEIADRAVGVLSKRIFVDLLPQLSDEDRFVLSDMLSDGELSDDEVRLFLQTMMEKYTDTVRESVDAFFDEMKTSIAAQKAA